MTTSKQQSILVVEDDSSLRYLAKRQLSKLGYIVVLAENGVDALHKMQNDKFDLVIMDVQMPKMDGLEATKEIRRYEQNHELSAIPILAMSANPHKQQCFDAGMNGFVFKPVSLNQLKNTLSEWLNKAA